MKSTSAASWVLGLILAATAGRLALGATIGLGVDESYAAVMGRRISLSYFDHPPMVFWWTGLAVRAAGSESPLAIRMPFITAFIVTTWLMFKLGSFLYGDGAGLWAAVLLNASLFLSVAAGGWALPDGPLVLFSAMAAVCLAKATIESPMGSSPGCNAQPGPGRKRWWLALGICLGLALLAKYHGFLLLGGVVVYLTTSRVRAGWLKRWEPYWALSCVAAVFLPVLVWNSTHGWASFKFQGGRALPIEGTGGTPLIDSVAGQAVWTLPWLWLPLCGVLLVALWRGPGDARRWLPVCLGAGPVFVFTFVAAIGSRGLPHWEEPGYFMLFPLLGDAVDRATGPWRNWVRLWLWGCCLGILITTLALAAHVQTGWLRQVSPALFRHGDPTRDLLGWSRVAEQLGAWGFPKPGVLIATARWDDAAKLAIALGPATEVACVGQDPRGFAFTRDSHSNLGADLALVVRRRPGPEPLVAYAPYFDSLHSLGEVPIVRGGQEEVSISIYLGRDLRGPLPVLQRR